MNEIIETFALQLLALIPSLDIFKSVTRKRVKCPIQFISTFCYTTYLCSVTFQVEQLFVAVILNPSFDSAAVAATADSGITLKRPIIVLYIRSLFLCSFCLLMHDISKTLQV